MKDKRMKFFQLSAIWLIQKGIKFTFNESYITSRLFDLTFDANDKSKIWIEEPGNKWISFSEVDVFRNFLKKKTV